MVGMVVCAQISPAEISPSRCERHPAFETSQIPGVCGYLQQYDKNERGGNSVIPQVSLRLCHTPLPQVYFYLYKQAGLEIYLLLQYYFSSILFSPHSRRHLTPAVSHLLFRVPQSETTVFNVGMTCEGCASATQRILTKMEGGR